MNLEHILVAVDYSECSRAALRFAVDFSATLRAELDVVHVWDRPSYLSDIMMTRAAPLSGASLLQMVEDDARRDLERFLAGCACSRGRSLTGRLVGGDPASALLRELKRGEHDAVVVGCRGRTGLSNLLLGSVAEKLVRLAPVPVLTVPGEAAPSAALSRKLRAD